MAEDKIENNRNENEGAEKSVREEEVPAPRPDISRKNQKRGIIIAFCVMAAFIIIWYAWSPAMNFVLTLFESEDTGATSDFSDKIMSYSFYAADYDENIFEDEDYMDKNRMLAYVYENNTFYVEIDPDGNYSSYDSTVEFFVRYFYAVMNGEYETYPEFFTDECIENYPSIIKERFTMQKLYDMVITYNSTSTATDADGNSVTAYYYYVDYKIYQNNGTFRNDIESDKTRTLIVELYVYSDGTILINYMGRGDDVVSADASSSSSCASAVSPLPALIAAFPFVFVGCRKERNEAKRSEAKRGSEN